MVAATSKKRWRVRTEHGYSPWFKRPGEVEAWLIAQKHEGWVRWEEGSAIRRTKATDARKRGHTHPPGETRCRVCGV